jgi:aminoacyl tRNA synthase complex-interacting multifunctional protein 1
MTDLQSYKPVSLSDVDSASEAQFPELNDEQKALAAQYETISGRLDEQESLTLLNDGLRTSTFLTGNHPSKADLVVFKAVLPVASQWKETDKIAAYRHIIRWADLVQNTLVSVPDAEKLVVDHNVELPREVKEKKKDKKEEKKDDKKEDKKPETKAKDEKKAGGELTEEEKKARAEAAKAKKAAKAKAKAELNAKQAATQAPPNPSMVDFRVGFIQKAVKHPDADSLYMSTIEMGDQDGPRTICSGLVKHVSLEDMQERYVVVIANLKPVTMRGVKSCGMVLCASKDGKVEFVNPPPGSKAGDKLFFEDFNGTPEKQLNPKKKIWEAVQPKFTTTESFEVTYTEEGKDPKKLVNEKGEPCKNLTLVAANVS